MIKLNVVISQEDIRKKALSWWPEILTATVKGEVCFPRCITRIGRIQPGDVLSNYASIQEQLSILLRSAKPAAAKSYVIHLKEYHFQKAGDHLLPDFIEFECLEDYLAFTGQQKEWEAFNAHRELIIKTIPALKQWVLQNVLQLTAAGIVWTDVLQVCLYFIEHPRPNLYIRQLPIEVHTKFIEQNATLLASLLDFLIPSAIRNPKERRIDRRYFLCYDDPLIRIRVLDRQVGLIHIRTTDLIENALTDISIPVPDFNGVSLPVKNVLIAENKMNFLTLPPLPKSIAIWSGGGFQVSGLRDASWLNAVNIYYWGDIDEHGFQILHQLRSYFPNTKSIMMDLETLMAFREQRGVGTKSKKEHLSLLTSEEETCYLQIKASSLNRLEQEKIDQQYVENYLRHHVIVTTAQR